MTDPIHDHVHALVAHGVYLPAPHLVTVAPDVDVRRIAPGVTLHPGTRLGGAATSIGPGCEIGREGPATVLDCQLGHAVKLAGGFFEEATFLDGAAMGSGAHVRPGTLLEEGASGAHSVGLKQTILFPWVTLGSLINFCDCLLAGGTGPRDHAEVGSSYIHFNFTPHYDKATASLVGDVPRGVILDQPPSFLGGQGGLVGPARVGFGVVIPAGVVWKGDLLEEHVLAPTAGPELALARPFRQGAYRSVDRLIRNNLHYIGNIRALQAWYRAVRQPLLAGDEFRAACCEGALRRLERVIEERIGRLGEVAVRMPESIRMARGIAELALPEEVLERQLAFHQAWPAMRDHLLAEPPPEVGAEDRDHLMSELGARGEVSYVGVIQALNPEVKAAGTRWLEGVVGWIVGGAD